jgi:hypothetical protein
MAQLNESKNCLENDPFRDTLIVKTVTKIYEAWESDGGCEITFAEVEGIKEQMARGLMPKNAKLLHRIEASYWEEAMTIHNEKMGWGKYKPEGEPKDCPNGCGAVFYPKGSGECPNCGKIC